MKEKQLRLFDRTPAHPSTPIEEVVGAARYQVRRIRPPVKAHGGKYYLARHIVPILLSAPGNPTEYLEPCAFGGSVFLALPRFEREILGDINPGVIDLWRTLSRARTATMLKSQLATIDYTEKNFEQAKCAEEISQLQRTLNFVIRSRFSRGGLGKAFAWSNRKRGGKPGDENAWDTFRDHTLPEIIDRARGVEVIQETCYWLVWESRLHAKRLIYADPPYMRETRTARQAYGKFEMTKREHFRLVAALKAHCGPAALSGYRSIDYDHWLKDWRRIDFEMANNSGQGKRKQRRTESVWINW